MPTTRHNDWRTDAITASSGQTGKTIVLVLNNAHLNLINSVAVLFPPTGDPIEDCVNQIRVTRPVRVGSNYRVGTV